ncbi:MAG: sugar phosphate isomerase/epimerase family protein [Terricaulis silvestris]
MAQWSLHRRFSAGLDPLAFPLLARRAFAIEAVEYVSRFYAERVHDIFFLAELKRRCDGEGVRSVLIMCDDEGALGDPDGGRRTQAVENHLKWIDAALFLGCHSIRVNAASQGARQEQMRLAADGLRRLAELAGKSAINVLVENHGGFSSDASWLADTLRLVDHPRIGALPDFGNFQISETECYDPYEGVRQLMPFAKGVSAKCYDFDTAGNETSLDFPLLLAIVLEAGYDGHIGIEYEGERLSETEGIGAAKALLQRLSGRAAGKPITGTI